jgi:hypothetical protein
MRAIILSIAVTAFLIAGSATAAAPKPPDWAAPELHACASDDDCASVNPPCGALLSVNRAYREEVQHWYDYVRPSFNCAVNANAARVAPACRHSRCAMAPLERKAPDRDDPAYCEHDDQCVAVVGECGKTAAVNVWHEAEARHRLGTPGQGVCADENPVAPANVRCEEHRCQADFPVAAR